MTEIKGHSEGIWRTFAVKRTPENDYVPKPIKEWFDSKKIRWSFQRYAVQPDEVAHISYRIEFPNTKLLTSFRKLISIHYEVLAETSWDEKIGTKRAYELGTKLYHLILEEYSEVRKNSMYLSIVLHGYFNNANYDYREEAAEYISFLSQLSPHMRRGLSIHDMDLEDD